jgi:hypothetical protein
LPTWRLAGCADYWAKYELGFHVSTTCNHRDAIRAVEIAIDEAERVLGRPLIADLDIYPETGEPIKIKLVSDNGPAFKAPGSPRSWSPPGCWSTSGPGAKAPDGTACESARSDR